MTNDMWENNDWLNADVARKWLPVPKCGCLMRNLMTPAGAGRGFNLGVGLTKPVATVTLCHCLVNTACAILPVFTSTHFVSCTIQCEETGFHLLSPPGRLKRGPFELRDFGSRKRKKAVFSVWREDFDAYDAKLLLSDKSVCHVSVVFLLLRHPDKAKSACP